MKRILGVFVIISILGFSNASYAEESETRYRFRAEGLNNLVFLPAYFFLGITIHEGSHAIGALAHGMEVYDFRPYPHYFRTDNDGIRTLLGACYIRWEKENPPSLGARMSAVLAPYATDILLFTISDSLLTFLPRLRNSFLGPVIYIASMVGPYIDFVYNLYNPSEGNDFAVASRLSGERRALFYSVGSVIAGIALWRLVQTGIRVFSESASQHEERLNRRRNRRTSNIQIAPLFGEINGLSIGMAM